MFRDIYQDYLQNKGEDNQKQEKVESKIIENNDLNKDLNQNEALIVLKQISSKLDNISIGNQTATNYSSSVTYDNSNYDLLITNGKVIIPGDGVINANILINNGKIVSITNENPTNVNRTIDATNKYISPGIIDPHVHLGLFAPLEKELETETVSALCGGVTTAGCFIGTEESHFNSFPSISETINKKSHIDIVPHLIINSENQIKEIRDYVEHLGVTSFKLYMNGIPGLIPDVDDGFILDVFEEIKKVDKQCIVCVHSENRDLVKRATNEVKQLKGDNANIVDWSNTHPTIAEEEAVIRLSYLAEKSGVPVYLVHISSSDAIKRIRKIKPFNKYLHVETTSPYLSLTKHSMSDNTIKMEPPFRDYEDVEELWKAVEDGIVDTIGTDNVTLSSTEKNIQDTLWNAIPGYPALETHLPVLLHEGVIKRGIAIEKIIDKITKVPAQTFGVYPQKGSMLPGSDADIVIIDLDKSKTVSPEKLSSRSDFSLYTGKNIQGWPVMTIKSGEIVVQEGTFIGKETKGKCLTR